MIVHRHVGRAGLEVRRVDAAHQAPRRHVHVLREIVPRLAGVARDPDLAVVGAGPHDALLRARRRNRRHHGAVELTEVVADDAAGELDAAGIARRQVRADDFPALAAIARAEDHLAAEVDRVVEPVDRERRRPVAAILQIDRIVIERVHPRTHRARLAAQFVIRGDVRGVKKPTLHKVGLFF